MKEFQFIPTAVPNAVDFIFYDLYRIFLEEQPEKAVEALQEGGIIIHPIVKNGLYFDWRYLVVEHPDKNIDELLVLYRQLVRFWPKEINRFHEGGYILPPEDFIYLQPPKNLYLTVTEREVRKRLMRAVKNVEQFTTEYPQFNPIEIRRDIILNYDTTIDDLWNLYRQEQSAQVVGMTVNDILSQPLSKNGLVFTWLVLKTDYPDKSKDERVAIFRQLARDGKIQVVIDY